MCKTVKYDLIVRTGPLRTFVMLMCPKMKTSLTSLLYIIYFFSAPLLLLQYHQFSAPRHFLLRLSLLLSYPSPPAVASLHSPFRWPVASAGSTLAITVCRGSLPPQRIGSEVGWRSGAAVWTPNEHRSKLTLRYTCQEINTSDYAQAHMWMFVQTQ